MPKGNCEFKGTGGQYFPAVFIHLMLLGGITLGIYAPWAWVRIWKLKASHTLINGKKVTFTGNGGDFFVLCLVQGLLTIITLGLYGPWAFCKIYRWKAENTLIEGRKSEFVGTGGSLFLLNLVHLVILPMLTFGLYYFWGIYRLYAWKEENTRYGGEKTSFGGGFGSFLKVALLSWILNTITLNLFSPWAMCMLYKWEVDGLAVGDDPKVQHFPKVKTNPIVVIVLIIIGLGIIATLAYIAKKQIMKIAALQSQAKLTAMANANRKIPNTWQQLKRSTTRSQYKGQNKTKGYERKDRISPARAKNYSQVSSPALQLELLVLDQLIKKDPKNASAYYNRGHVFQKLGNLKAAIRDYTAAIELNGKDSDAFYNRGLVYARAGNYDAALKDFAIAIKLNPMSADAYCNRGNMNFLLGRLEQAIQDYSAAIKISPRDPSLYHNRAVVYKKLGRNKEAEKDSLKARQLGWKSKQSQSSKKWRMDLTGVEIPATPAQGRIHGHPFYVQKARLKHGILTISEGKEFFPDREFMIFLFLKKGEKVEGRTISISPKDIGKAHVHMKWKEKGKDVPEVKIFVKDYVMRIEFGQRDGDILPGKIYLCIPDQEKSFVAGSFEAQIS